MLHKEKKRPKYTPISKRQDRPDAILWLVKNYPELSDGQIGKLVGSTKGTISLIRSRSYWNFLNLTAKDPVAINLCSQLDILNAAKKAKRKVELAKKKTEKENKNINTDLKNENSK